MSVSELLDATGMTMAEVAQATGYAERTVYKWRRGTTVPRPPVVAMLKQFASSHRAGRAVEGQFRFIDLFAGIGGFRLGFEAIGGQCVFTSEWNKFSQQTYRANFDCDHDIVGDITQIAAEDIPAHDVLLAGFPCQPFSIAGVSKKNALGRPHGFECKTQGTLFFDVARILAHHRPAAFVLENVKNLRSHDKGRTFQVIKDTLDELGYAYSVKVIDAKGYVPQHRERIFIVGFRENVGLNLKDLEVADPASGPRLKTILHPDEGKLEIEPPYTDEEGLVSSKYTLTANLWRYLRDYAAKHKAKGNGFGYGLNTRADVARTLSARYYKDGSEILISRGPRARPRRLTPRECARLMGFDRPRRPRFNIPVSDTQAYRQFGNAVVVPVVEEVARFMKPGIMELVAQQGPQFAMLSTETREPRSDQALG